MDAPRSTDGTAAVLAIIVVFHPDLSRLSLALDAACAQCQRVCVVVNGADPATEKWLNDRQRRGSIHKLILAPRNHGLGWAHNRGVEDARASGMSHVLLLDQDSVLDADGVSRLLGAERDLGRRGVRPGAVAAEFRDSRTAVSYSFLQWTGLRFRKVRRPERDLLPVDHAISSGSLIPLTVLETVGGLREDFFIDYVDVEWCHRARHAGYPVYGLTMPLVDHQLGHGVRRLPCGIALLPLHPAWRVYYIFRNALLLYRAPHIPRMWALQHFRRLCAKGFAILVLCPGRRRYTRAIMDGMIDGLRGRSGACGRFLPKVDPAMDSPTVNTGQWSRVSPPRSSGKAVGVSAQGGMQVASRSSGSASGDRSAPAGVPTSRETPGR